MGLGLSNWWRKWFLHGRRTRTREPWHRWQGAGSPWVCHCGWCWFHCYCLQRVEKWYVFDSIKVKSTILNKNVLKENPFKTYTGFCSTIKVTLQQASRWIQWIKWFWTWWMMLAAGNRAIVLWWPALITPCIRQRNSPCSRVPTVTGNKFEFKVR